MTMPATRAVINVGMNNFGPSTVEGYFVEAGFIGVVATPHNPPQWFKDQQRKGVMGHPEDDYIMVFGAENS